MTSYPPRKYAGKKKRFETGKLLNNPFENVFGDTLGEDMHLRFAVSRYITSNHAP